MNHLLIKAEQLRCPELGQCPVLGQANLNHRGFISLVKGGAHKHSHQPWPDHGDQWGTDNTLQHGYTDLL